MTERSLYRTCGLAAATGAVAVAAAITLEGFTDPVDRPEHYHAGLALPVNLGLFVGFVVFLMGMCGVLLAQGTRLGRPGLGGGFALLFGLAIAELPHTVVDFAVAPALFDRLPHAQARTLLEDHIDDLVGPLSGIGLLLLLVGLALLVRATLRAGMLPRWAPLASAWAVPCAIALGVLSGPLPLAPHPPVALYLGLAAYGLGLRAALAPERPAAAGALEPQAA
jgi:hypothetical protein